MSPDEDRVLRSSVPERWKNCASPIGAVQSYIAEMERALAHLGYDVGDEKYFALIEQLPPRDES